MEHRLLASLKSPCRAFAARMDYATSHIEAVTTCADTTTVYIVPITSHVDAVKSHAEAVAAYTGTVIFHAEATTAHTAHAKALTDDARPT